MNTTPSPLPSFRLLYQRDTIIQRAVNAIIAGVVGAAGVVWATQPAKSPPPGVDLSFELAAGRWAPVGGAAVSALGGIVLMRRHRLVKQILSQGTTVQATVTDLELVTTTVGSESSTSEIRRPTRRAYFATLQYEVNGREQKVCLRLPGPGFVYGLVKGRETELAVLEWMPKKPLIRSVYLGQA